MSTVVIGKSGQLATELSSLTGSDTLFLGRDDIDITAAESISSTLDALNISNVINAAAYTAVDKAESDETACRAVNELAVRNLAEYCKSRNLFMVHVSTDYVFSGSKGSPYLVDDLIAPQGVYGASKADGESILLKLLPQSSCIIRTSWVYSARGNNFVKTMLRLMREKPELSVIDDQIGSPTWAHGLAKACLYAANTRLDGVYHWTDEGVASWFDFATAIQRLAIEKGMLKYAIPIKPIPSSEFPTPAKRPHYSVLDKSLTRLNFKEVGLKHWESQLNKMLDELHQQVQKKEQS
uniref:dTDP-4-dehydrorhamnose reductase n=1 Tax=Ningiella ruwaisensis TaxID=2364274 RepID=UPI00109F6FE0|nr:dTDP-4-dehydrorhamnose reductase [Ningiella ruwaisensis]